MRAEFTEAKASKASADKLFANLNVVSDWGFDYSADADLCRGTVEFLRLGGLVVHKMSFTMGFCCACEALLRQPSLPLQDATCDTQSQVDRMSMF